MTFTEIMITISKAISVTRAIRKPAPHRPERGARARPPPRQRRREAVAPSRKKGGGRAEAGRSCVRSPRRRRRGGTSSGVVFRESGRVVWRRPLEGGSFTFVTLLLEVRRGESVAARPRREEQAVASPCSNCHSASLQICAGKPVLWRDDDTKIPHISRS